MFLPVGAKAGLRNVKTGNQAVNCCMKDPHSLLWGGGGFVAHQAPGKVFHGLWCAGQDPHLAGGSPDNQGLDVGLQIWKANR